MERAASVFVDWFVQTFNHVEDRVGVFSGIGNNGGDGLAIARMLSIRGYGVSVFVVGDPHEGSVDFKLNFSILPEPVFVQVVSDVDDVAVDFGMIIDGLFGVGINRPVSGISLQVIEEINKSKATKISIDLPSGLPADKVLDGEVVVADYTVTFQTPKLSLFFPEHGRYVGKMVLLPIGMEEDDFDGFDGGFHYLQRPDVSLLHKRFHAFSHKGDFGRILLAGGSLGKMGAIGLTSMAAFRSGSGMVTSLVPGCGLQVLQTLAPEVMVEVCEAYENLSLPIKLKDYDAIGVGPGMGQSEKAIEVLEYMVSCFSGPMVIDADGINILASNRHLFKHLKNKVLTPHLVEFERLVGKCASHIERMAKAREFVLTHQCAVVLKGAYTLVSLPDGRQIFNSTGNQYMATAGSGDVLTGVITSFLGQGYSLDNASLCGVYHHGLAGEIASASKLRGTIATDIIVALPETFRVLQIP